MNGQKSFPEKLFAFLNKLGNYIMLNLLFLVSCLPVVTIGQAWCALLTAIRYEIRGERWQEGYKFGFKTRFWRGTIVWCVMLAISASLLLDMNNNWQMGYTGALITSCAVFALVSMMTVALLLLNVYIPTSIYNWLRNAASAVFKGHVFLLLSGAVFWLPVLLFVFVPGVFFVVLIAFLALYFTFAGYGMTMLMKLTLIDLITDARAEGTLLAEEGRRGKVAEED